LAWSARQLLVGGWIRVACGPHLAVKRRALAAYASQTTNLTGEASWSYLSPEFVSLFLQPTELFQPVLNHHGAPSPASPSPASPSPACPSPASGQVGE
jgi:LmbE family N-acetylglucosaminyl deacetylase